MTGTKEARKRYLSGLRPMRKKAGLTQDELAAVAGVSKQSVSLWESGDRWPSAEHLPALARACGCEITDLYGEEGETET